MKSSIILFLVTSFSIHLFAQQIFLDEDYSDWNTITTTLTDPNGDTGFLGHDFKQVWVHNDDKYLYINFELALDLTLQDPNEIAIKIDTDNNANTGETTGDVGADVIYYPGNRNGIVFINGSVFGIDHIDIGYVNSPTVSSKRFELKLNREINLGGNNLSMEENIKISIIDEVNNGDQFPDHDNGFAYKLIDDPQVLPELSLSKDANDDLRILSFNVERDALFENGTEQPLSRIIKAINPDIIAFQEIYDHGAITTANKVSDIFDDPDQNWYSAKVNPDVIMVSQYPILEHAQIAADGNGAFLIRKSGNEILFINLHLPCCDNNTGRLQEVNNIIEFVDDLKKGLGPFPLKENTPIVILGDTNFVGHKEQVALIKNGISPGIDWGKPLEDAKPMTTGEPMAITWYQPFSSYCPGRLDYIFYSGSILKKKNSFVLFTPGLENNVLDTYNLNKDDSTNGSDHLATVVDFEWNPIVSSEETISGPTFRIAPNPTSDRIHIQVEEVSSYNATLVSNLGKIMWRTSFIGNQAHYDIGHFPRGVYRFILSDEKSTTSKNLMIH